MAKNYNWVDLYMNNPKIYPPSDTDGYADGFVFGSLGDVVVEVALSQDNPDEFSINSAHFWLSDDGTGYNFKLNK
jgi:hypothetical protein